MKRLFGLIGLTYLSVLAVVFYFYSETVLRIAVGLSLTSIVLGIVFIIIRKLENYNKAILIIGISAMFACFAIILYSNYYYLPLVEKYSEKELNISGYVCDEVQVSESSAIYTIQTKAINGEAEKIKLQLVSYTDLGAEDFDCVNADLTLYKTSTNSLISSGIFFRAYTSDVYNFETTGEKHSSIYSMAVAVRKAMKNSLDSLLPEDYSSMCKAVLLGDKDSLSYDIRSSFSNTGSSFLIVVSGMHLAVVAAFVLFLIKNFTRNRFILCLSVCLIVFLFMAITGFHSSVVRAGVMLIITYCAHVVLRRSDSVNSLGFAALVLTLPNPYAVGDIGLILSFSATLGIILWAGKIYDFVISKLAIKLKLLKSAINLISVSVAASLWVIPVTMLAFGRVSSYVVIISLLAEPAVSILIVCSLLAVVLYFLPFVSFISYPFALMCGVFSKYLIWIVELISSLPYSYFNSDKPHFYIWLAATVLLVIIGYAIRAGGFYIKSSIVFSFVIFIACCLTGTLIADSSSAITIYSVGSGVTAAVHSGSNISLLACGGSATARETVIDDISDDHFSVDYVIIPNNKNKYSRFQSEILNQFDVSSILLYDKDSSNSQLISEYDGNSRYVFGDDVQFVVNLTDTVTDTVVSVNSVTYQFIKGSNSSLLFVPSGGDIATVPEEFRNADYALLDSVPDNSQLLDCNSLIYSESVSKFEEDYNLLKEICSNVICVTDLNIEINL